MALDRWVFLWFLLFWFGLFFPAWKVKQFGVFLKDVTSSSKNYFSCVNIQTRVQYYAVSSLWELSYLMASSETALIGSVRERILILMDH